MPFIRTLGTVHLYGHLRAHQRADGAPGAFAAVREGSGNVSAGVDFAGRRDKLLWAEGGAYLAALAEFLVYLYVPFHRFHTRRRDEKVVAARPRPEEGLASNQRPGSPHAKHTPMIMILMQHPELRKAHTGAPSRELPASLNDRVGRFAYCPEELDGQESCHELEAVFSPESFPLAGVSERADPEARRAAYALARLAEYSEFLACDWHASEDLAFSLPCGRDVTVASRFPLHFYDFLTLRAENRP